MDRFIEKLFTPKGKRIIYLFFVIGIFITSIELYEHIKNQTEFVLFINLLYIPIIFTAFTYGIKGGFFSGLLSGVLIRIMMSNSYLGYLLSSVDKWKSQMFLYIFIGIGVGILFSFLQYQNEKIIRINNKRLKEITSVLGEGVYILDGKGKLLFLNSEAEKILGWKEVELIGKEIHDYIHYETLNGLPISSSECPILANIKDKDNDHSGEDVFITKKGEKKLVSFRSARISVDEEFTGFITTFRDISKVKSTERSLKDTHNELERFKVALDQHAIVGISDINGTIIYVNDKFSDISQYTKKELIGKNFNIVNSGYHSDSFFEKMWGRIKLGEIFKEEIINRNPNERNSRFRSIIRI